MSKNIITKINEYLNNLNNYTTLKEVFEDYPDDTELIWNYVGSDVFNNYQFKISETDINDIITLEIIDNFNNNAKKWQKKYVDNIVKNIDKYINIPIIVDFEDNVIIDGNHKLIAFYISKLRKVKTIDINQ